MTESPTLPLCVEILYCQGKAGPARWEPRIAGGAICPSPIQAAMSFQRNKPVIFGHMRISHDNSELQRKATVAAFATVAREATNCETPGCEYSLRLNTEALHDTILFAESTGGRA